VSKLDRGDAVGVAVLKLCRDSLAMGLLELAMASRPQGADVEIGAGLRFWKVGQR
jgi:hypothetical protein